MLLISLAVSTCLLTSPPVQPRHIAYEVRLVNGAWCHVVKVNLNAPSVKVSGVVAQAIGAVESAEVLVQRSRPTVAISGTFHGTARKRPIGDIIIDGTPAHRGHFPSCLAIDWYNQAAIVTPQWGKTKDWSNYEFVLGGLIRLMRQGKVQPEVSRNTSHVLRPSERAAVGLTPHNKLLLFTTRKKLTLSETGRILKQLGAREAVCLDGGSSTTLYYRGKMLVKPTRKLTNLLIVYEDKEQYLRRKDALSPSGQKVARQAAGPRG